VFHNVLTINATYFPRQPNLVHLNNGVEMFSFIGSRTFMCNLHTHQLSNGLAIAQLVGH